MLDRKHPYFCFVIGLVLCGLKFPFNWFSGEDVERKAAMQKTSFGILPSGDGTLEDSRMEDAWQRIETAGRPMHDLTNLAIEWTRRWVPYATKFLCMIFVYGFIALVTLVVGLSIITYVIAPARAHDWYSAAQDPVYSSDCCGGHDCAPLNAEWVKVEGDGYRVRMTVEQSRTINPSSTEPVNAFVPGERVQSPPEHSDKPFYACVYDKDRGPPRHGIICFFATPTM